MSAYVVDKATIDAIVHAAITARSSFGPFAYYHGDQTLHGSSCWCRGRHDSRTPWHDVTEATASAVGQMLWDANIASVNYRYPDTVGNDAALPSRKGHDTGVSYTYPERALLLAPPPDVGFAAKQLSCFNYQTCERPDYEQSEAFAFVQALREALLKRLQTYQSAPWGVAEYPQEAVSA